MISCSPFSFLLLWFNNKCQEYRRLSSSPSPSFLLIHPFTFLNSLTDSIAITAITPTYPSCTVLLALLPSVSTIISSPLLTFITSSSVSLIRSDSGSSCSHPPLLLDCYCCCCCFQLSSFSVGVGVGDSRSRSIFVHVLLQVWLLLVVVVVVVVGLCLLLIVVFKMVGCISRPLLTMELEVLPLPLTQSLSLLHYWKCSFPLAAPSSEHLLGCYGWWNVRVPNDFPLHTIIRCPLIHHHILYLRLSHHFSLKWFCSHLLPLYPSPLSLFLYRSLALIHSN